MKSAELLLLAGDAGAYFMRMCGIRGDYKQLFIDLLRLLERSPAPSRTQKWHVYVFYVGNRDKCMYGTVYAVVAECACSGRICTLWLDVHAGLFSHTSVRVHGVQGHVQGKLPR
jgi:hypothetical protein